MAEEQLEQENTDETEEDDRPGWARVGCWLAFLSLLGVIAWFLFPWIGWRRTIRKKKEARQARKQ